MNEEPHALLAEGPCGYEEAGLGVSQMLRREQRLGGILRANYLDDTA